MNLKKSETGIAHIGIVLLFVVLVVVGFAGWRVYDKQSSDNKAENKRVELKNDKSLDEVLAELKTTVPKDFKQIKLNDKSKGEKFGAVIYDKLAGYDFTVGVTTEKYIEFGLNQPAKGAPDNPPEGYDINKANEDAAKADAEQRKPIAEKIKVILTQNNFKQEERPKSANEPPVDLNTTSFGRDDAVCELNSYTEYVTLSCVTKDELTAAAKAYQPFVDALPKNVKDSVFFDVETGTGQSKNDKYAVLGLGHGSAYFYQKDDRWAYLTTTVNGLPCDDKLLEKNATAKDALINICLKPGESGIPL